MLTIYSKNVSFQKNENDMYFGSLGYGVLRDLYTDPLITEELNGSYILEFNYKIDGSLNEYLIEENVIKACGQPFVIYDVKKDTSKISILAKHWVLNEWSKDFLLDVAPTSLSAQDALNWIQKRGDNQVDITINGDCDKIASARYVRKNIINAIYNEDNALLTRFGGELSFDKNSVFVHKKRGSDTGLTIRERKNLSGIEFHLDFSTVATKLLPLGKDGLLLDEIYVESPLIDRYLTPIIKKFEIDTEDQEELYNYCQNLFENDIDKPSISIKIDFIELSKTIEYKKYSNIESIHLGDAVTAYIPSLDLNVKTRVVKTVYNCNVNRIISLELGTCIPNIANSNAAIENNINKILNEQLSFLAQAKRDASDLMKHPFGGYVFFSENEGCIYIADSKDLNSATNVWKWGLGGLGFSSTGVNGNYETAITQDGSIVADFITTGKLNTDVIEGYNELLLSVSKIDNQIIPTSQATGSYIHVEDSSDAPLINLEIEGKSEQKTRSGKNLLPFEVGYTETKNGVTLEVLENGIKLKGAPTITSGYIPFNYYVSLPAGPYTVFFPENRDGLGVQNPSSNLNFGIADSNKIRSATLSGNIEGYGSINVRYDVGELNEIITPMLLKGTYNEQQLYEAYGVSPSPDYHSEINSVGYENLFNKSKVEIGKSWHGGSNVNRASFVIEYEQNKDYSITLDNFDYISSIAIVEANEIVGSGAVYTQIFNDIFKFTHKMSSTAKFLCIQIETTDIFTEEILNQINIQLNEGVKVHKYIPYGKYGIEVKTIGKNSLKNTAVSDTYRGITRTINADGTVIFNGTTTGWGNLVVGTIVGDGNEYIISGSPTNVASTVFLSVNNATEGDIATSKQGAETVFIPKLGSVYDVICCSGPGVTLNNVVFKPMIRLSSETDSTYEKYKENATLLVLDQPLRNLPNRVKDVAYIKNNKLYVERKVGRFVFDGNENWTRHNDTRQLYYIPTTDIKIKKPASNTIAPNVLCNYLTKIPYWFDGTNDIFGGENGISIDITQNRFYIGAKEMNGVSDLATFKIWLSTYNTEVIYELAEPYTEELGGIEMPSTFKGVTNITTTDELEPIINLEYVRDTTLSSYVEKQLQNERVIREENIAQLIIENNQIKESVSSVSADLSSANTTINKVEETLNSQEKIIEIISTNIDQTTGAVKEVTTTNGFTFNNKGLNIYTDENSYNTQINNVGTYYKDGDEIVSQTTKDGSLLKNLSQQGQSKYSYDDTNKIYDFVEERIEVDGESAYATFYNGEE